MLDPAGNPFGAVRQFNPPAVAQPFIWTPLTRAGFPPNPCGITVTNQVSAASGGEEAHFQVVDAAGTVYTLDCNVINSSGRFVLFCGNATWQLAVSQP
ncbi:hypothetical protein C3488_16075 [Streptomyces sp. Ru72]|nr:hypothetical protein C3488_16075 [Streptomyces sp. Ru72]